ncbi:hypothetical protein CY0110_18482 [Crocosphaera chwakensis CCY0110]|uniref:Uncharacterized protein n=1 Tax=Crocosphaera chwakensis CCY0110 TaxID=391612 RepID=A3IJ28_9CHRO|nr:hypothetical protein CY0110_18482 [Crocosphaera chwakensis CCY0110]
MSHRMNHPANHKPCNGESFSR